MRLALSLGPNLWLKPGGVQQSIELTKQAESLGFDTAWASEDPDGWDAFSALSAISQHTSKIRLGTGVTNPYMRHPNLIAASIASLDHVSGGRAFLGLGRGEPEWYRTAFGMTIGSPLRRVAETVDLLQQWWNPDQTATMDGEITVRDWRRVLPPVGPPPLYLAATGPKMSHLAGQIADGMRVNRLSSFAAIRTGIERARDASRAAGRDWSSFAVTADPSLTLTKTNAEIEQVLEQKKSFIAYIHVLPGMHQLLAGLEEQFDIEQILADVRSAMNTTAILERGGSFADLRRSGDLAAARLAIPVELMDKLAVVGPLDRILPRLRDLATLGVTDMFANPRDLTDPTVVAGLASL